MGLDYLYFITIQFFISEVIASYASSPYIQYAAVPYPSTGYMYPSLGYSSKPTVYAQPYIPPAYQPPYSPTPSPVRVPGYAPATAYQPSYAQTQPVPPKIPQPYQPQYQAPTPVPYKPPANPATASVNKVNPIKPASYQSSNALDSPVGPQPIIYRASYQQPPKPQAIPAIPNPPSDSIAPAHYLSKEPLSSPKPSKSVPGCPPFDTNVLNNLAIALQLLIVSNLIHNPPPDSNPLPALLTDDAVPSIAPLPIPYIPPSTEPSNPHHEYVNSYFPIPNANFLGSAGFGDTGISKSMMSGYGSPTPPNPRPSGFMSPYDAIGPNSPYADMTSTKKEPKSPYHLSSDYKDLFSLTELFKI